MLVVSDNFAVFLESFQLFGEVLIFYFTFVGLEFELLNHFARISINVESLRIIF